MTLRQGGTLIIAVIAIACAWYAITKYAAAREQTEFAFFSQALQQANVQEQVVVGTVRYNVNNGIVSEIGTSSAITKDAALPALRLAYAKAAAERSPLMALPNVDLPSLATSINELADTQNGLASIQSNASQASAVRSSLYPISFLQAMNASEAARRAFIESGSDIDELAYENAQTKAMSAYQNDLSSFMSTFEDIVPASTSAYADTAYLVTRTGMLSEIQALADGNQKVHAQFLARDACFAGTISSCDISALQFATTSIPIASVVTPSQTSLANEILSLLTSLSVPGVRSTEAIQLSNSVCTEGLGGAPRFSIVTKGATTTKITYLGNVRFVKASDATDTPFGQFLVSDGIEYVFDSPMTHYTCLGFDQDVANIFSTWDIANFARTTPASTYATSTVDKSSLRDLETELSDPTLVTENNAISYLIVAHSISSVLSTSTAAQLDSLYLETIDGDAGFVPFVDMVGSTEATNVQLYRENVPIALSAPYLFYIRSGFLGLFMSNNPSVVGPQSAPFPPDTVPIAQQPYVLLSQLSGAARTKAISDMLAFIHLHVDAASAASF